MQSQKLTIYILLGVVAVLGSEFIRQAVASRRAASKQRADSLATVAKRRNAPQGDSSRRQTVADSIAKIYSPMVFRDAQIKNPRVKAAYQAKGARLQQWYDSLKISPEQVNIYLRAFKKEALLEVWIKPKDREDYQLLTTYKFCKNTGKLGPKLKAGDKQIPEGFYHIDRFNPQSKFHLSLGLNYPNRVDKAIGDTTDLGSDIFIHGGCETVGCIPITDDKIKELYLLATDARAAGQKKIPVSIFPTRLSPEAYTRLQQEYREDRKLLKFWRGLKEAYNQFEKCKRLPNITLLPTGDYKSTTNCQ